MLKHGGAFARFANHPYRDKGNPDLSKEIDKLYSKYYYEYYGKDIKKNETEYSEEQAVERAKIAEKYGFAGGTQMQNKLSYTDNQGKKYFQTFLL